MHYALQNASRASHAARTRGCYCGPIGGGGQAQQAPRQARTNSIADFLAPVRACAPSLHISDSCAEQVVG